MTLSLGFLLRVSRRTVSSAREQLLPMKFRQSCRPLQLKVKGDMSEIRRSESVILCEWGKMTIVGNRHPPARLVESLRDHV